MHPYLLYLRRRLIPLDANPPTRGDRRPLAPELELRAREQRAKRRRRFVRRALHVVKLQRRATRREPAVG